MIDTTIDGNTSTSNGGGGVLAAYATLELRRTTVSGNSAPVPLGGGGLYLQSNAKASIIDSTISGNSAMQAAAVWCGCRGLRLVSTTVTNNSNNASDGLYAGAVVNASRPAMQWSNSIVAGNTSTIGGPDCRGHLKSRGYNLIGGAGLTADTVGCQRVNQESTDLIGVEPMLGPLGSNGGPTQTHALLAGSPAIDAGDPRPPADRAMRCPTIDQRGVARNGRCDIGAFEY